MANNELEKPANSPRPEKRRYYSKKKNTAPAKVEGTVEFGKIAPPMKEKVTQAKPNKAKSSETGVKQPQHRNTTQRRKATNTLSKIPVNIAFLGGLNEVGKNMTLYECNDDMMMVDCGLAFPDADLPGVDLVIPDFTYVEKNADKIKGVVITHGHEDHIGGLAFMLKKVKIPVYGTKFTIGLIRGKLKEHGILNSCSLNVIEPGDVISLGCFDVEFIHVNHSIPDAVALAITSPAGTIIQTGDFKIDTTPIDGDMIDLGRFAEIGKKGVLALLSDSTNAEKPGYTTSEKKVGESFETLFRKAENKRIIVATFASNIHRVQQIIDIAKKIDRKVAVIGRSLENVVAIGQELGYLNVPEGVLIPLDATRSYPKEKLIIITTGSQGEPMSALTRMAFSEHRKVELTPNDCVIISATPIPGNEKTVGKVINEIMKLGADVVYERMYEVHVSGHACQEELKIIMGLVKPKYFIPVHGEQKHLQKHAGLAVSMGITSDRILIADNGHKIEISEDRMKFVGTVPSGKVFVDGSGVGDVGNIVLKDRKHLAQDGLIIVVATIDSASGIIQSGPDIVSRGFIYVRESENLIRECRNLAAGILDECAKQDNHDWNTIKAKLRDDVSKLMYERTKRSPMILPILMEI